MLLKENYTSKVIEYEDRKQTFCLESIDLNGSLRDNWKKKKETTGCQLKELEF